MCIMSVQSFLNSFSVPKLTLLVTFISVTVSGSSADVCVETEDEDATTVRLILIDATKQRRVRNSEK